MFFTAIINCDLYFLGGSLIWQGHNHIHDLIDSYKVKVSSDQINGTFYSKDSHYTEEHSLSMTLKHAQKSVFDMVTSRHQIKELSDLQLLCFQLSLIKA